MIVEDEPRTVQGRQAREQLRDVLRSRYPVQDGKSMNMSHMSMLVKMTMTGVGHVFGVHGRGRALKV